MRCRWDNVAESVSGGRQGSEFVGTGLKVDLSISRHALTHACVQESQREHKIVTVLVSWQKQHRFG